MLVGRGIDIGAEGVGSGLGVLAEGFFFIGLCTRSL
jgi:hypothetical protein